MRRSVVSDLQLRAGSTPWLTATTGHVQDASVRTRLSIEPDVQLQEDVFVRIEGESVRVSVSYGQSVMREGHVHGTGGCVLSTDPEPQPL